MKSSKFTKIIQLYVLIVGIAALLFSVYGCSYSKSKTVEETSSKATEVINNTESTMINEVPPTKTTGDINNSDSTTAKDTEYKLFYGEWKVNKILGKHLTLSVETEIAEKILGKRITYSIDSVKNDDIEKVINPNYNYAIVPITQNKTYVEKMPSLQQLGIDGEYFVYVYVYNTTGQGDDILGTEFYIKDDSTLVMLYNDVYYELKRISYIEDAEIKQVHP